MACSDQWRAESIRAIEQEFMVHGVRRYLLIGDAQHEDGHIVTEVVLLEF